MCSATQRDKLYILKRQVKSHAQKVYSQKRGTETWWEGDGSREDDMNSNKLDVELEIKSHLESLSPVSGSADHTLSTVLDTKERAHQWQWNIQNETCLGTHRDGISLGIRWRSIDPWLTAHCKLASCSEHKMFHFFNFGFWHFMVN